MRLFAVAGEPIPKCVLPEVEVFLGEVPIAVYETPGTQKFADTIIPGRNYGVAIIILVVVVRALLHPLTRASQINMAKMGKKMRTIQPLIEATMPAGCACTAVSLPSLPVRASSQANAKCGRLRRCVPAWKTRAVRRIVSLSIRLWAMFLVQGFSQ